MALLEDVEPLLIGARIFGCTPHRVTEKDIFVTKWGLVYSFFLGLIFLYGCVAGVYLITNDVMEMKILMLTAGRTILSYICFFTDAILTLVWNDRLRNAIANLQDFDLSTRFGQKMNFSLLRRCRIVIGIIVVFWCIVGYFTYRCEQSSALFNGLTYGIVNAAMSMQVFKFIGFLTLVYQRFGHLERLISPEVTKIASLSQQIQRTKLHDVWWLHCRLINSAEEINSVYTVQLLFWITTMFLNALSRIYTLTGSDGDLSFFKIRESLSVIACLVNLFIITVMCHFTAVQGNRIGSAIFSPSSVLMRKRCLAEDNIEVGMYFHLKKLHFSAGSGFIRIDLPLLLSIGGAMTTYLVILHALSS